MHELVTYQQESIDSIENYIQESRNNVKKSTDDLLVSTDYSSETSFVTISGIAIALLAFLFTK
jgi:t-SNARE complex subunit (syntaxin)